MKGLTVMETREMSMTQIETKLGEYIKKLEEWSERQKKRVSDCIVLAQNIYVNTIATERSFWCAFCGKEIKDQAPMLV